jgi:hypothetical protein
VRAAVALAAAAVAALAPTATAHARRTCGGGVTLADSRAVRVLIVNEADAFVCVRKSGRRHHLASFNGYGDGCVHECESLPVVRVTRRYVAWIYHYDFSYGGDVPDVHYSRVQVFRVRDGRQVRAYSTDSAQLLLDPHGETVTLEIAPTGAGTLTAHPVSGGARVLDAGAIAGVTLRGETVSWTNAGAVKQATLR